VVFRSPFSRVELNEDGTDPTMAGVTYPVGDESAMVKLGWIAAYGKGFDFADPDTVAELIDMVTGKEQASRKVRALLDSHQHAVTMKEEQKLAVAKALVMSTPDCAAVAATATASAGRHSTCPDPSPQRPASSLLAQWQQQSSQPLSPTEKSAIVTKLTSTSAHGLTELFLNGGHEIDDHQRVSRNPRGTIAEFLVPFESRGGTLPYTSEFSPERTEAVNFFARNATEEQWRELQAALKVQSERSSWSRYQ